MSMISESSDRIVPLGSADSSPSADEGCDGIGAYFGGNVQLKKGPWTSAEDAVLVEYVTEHGEGNWNSVQRQSGLARCGKSCRLRWANHLRPDLKKGAFTPEEERRIIELHAKMGNKWARMAAELPGRTDNEIKNYWNTRVKRQQRAGLPIYPADISLQALTESKNGNMYAFSDENPEIMPIIGIDIPTVEFKSSHLYSSSSLLDIPTHNFHEMLINNSMLVSHNNDTLLSALYPTKRLKQSESFFPSFGDGFSHHHHHHHVSADDVQSFGILSGYDENLTSNVLPVYSHGNGTYSSSDPTWAKKLELPSLQTLMGSTRDSSSSSSPLPSLESSPPTESGGLSPRNSGLLDAVLHESNYLKTRVELVDESSLDLHDAELEAFNDLNSHFDYSTALPMFSNNYMFLDESSFIE